MIYLAKVRLKNITKRFGKVWAVKNLSLEVKDKEFLVLLGPSGCGKTTTLRCIAGLETQDEGDVYVGDKIVNEIRPKDRDLAMVFQSYALYPYMDVFSNIAFPLKMSNVPIEDIQKRVKQVTELLDIDELLERKPAQLSGGQKQRVALGRAIVRNPQAFLMDEPLSNLDAKLRVYMRTELKKLQNELGVTTIYVTHDQLEAMTMADDIAVMDEGVLQQLSNPFDIFTNPNNLFVAGFIGSPPMNFINCVFKEKGKSSLLDAGAFTMPISGTPVNLIKKNSTGSELILGFRPEDIYLNKKKTVKHFIKAKVYVIEPVGSEVIIDFMIGGEIIKAKSSPKLKISTGEEMWLGFDKDRMHIFDRKTKKAII